MNSCEKNASEPTNEVELANKKKVYRGTSRLSDDYHLILTNFLHKTAH